MVGRFLRQVEWLLLALVIVATGVILHGAIGRFYRAAYPVGYADIVERESSRNQLPPALIYAVIRTESGFNPRAQSSVRARGLMQITEDTFEWAQFRIREDQPLDFEMLYDSELNIRYGSAILGLLLEEFGTVENALCAYHAGWGAAKQWLQNPEYAPDGKHIQVIPYSDTKQYVEKVLRTRQTYEALYK